MRKACIYILLLIYMLSACEKKESDYKDVVVVEKQELNVLWIIAEDLSPNLSCYGDNTVNTKNIDRFAAGSLLYTNAYSTSPFGYPSRSAIFTGVFPHLTGTQHVSTTGKQTEILPPAEIKIFTEYLRAAGYHCSFRGDVVFPFGEAFTMWNEVSSHEDGKNYRAAWENRPEGKPFFSTIYLSQTKEQNNLPKEQLEKILPEIYPNFSVEDIKKYIDELYSSEEYQNIKIEPSKIKTPDYLSKSETVKKDFIKMYLNIKRLDNEVGKILTQLQTDKLDENTIIFFFSENGRGLPGGKRWLYDDGIKVPLIIKIPRVTPAGGRSEQLISLIDLAPTLMVNLDMRTPDYMQGQVFIGKRINDPRAHVFAARDRIDNADEKLRCVSDKQFKYIKNYTSTIPFDEEVELLPLFPTIKVMEKVSVDKQLEKATDKFIRKKPAEELYDLKNDPLELHNLAERDYFLNDLNKMRELYAEAEASIGGFIDTPEKEMLLAMDPGEGVELFTDIPKISPEGGRFGKAVEISISCNTAGASIAYAILPDGETDIQWEIYQKPFNLDRNCTLLTKAVRYGFEESAIRSVSYTFDLVQ